jgi:hypothetical protein
MDNQASRGIAEDEMRRLHFKIIGTIYARSGSTPADLQRNGDDARDAASAVLNSDIELLELYSAQAISSVNSFRSIDQARDVLRNQNVSDPAQYITIESVSAYKRLANAFLDIKQAHRGADIGGITSILLMSNDADRWFIEKIIDERLPATPQQLRDMLAEMKRSPQPLASGSL